MQPHFPVYGVRCTQKPSPHSFSSRRQKVTDMSGLIGCGQKEERVRMQPGGSSVVASDNRRDISMSL